jgi:hypothetical protein
MKSSLALVAGLVFVKPSQAKSRMIGGPQKRQELVEQMNWRAHQIAGAIVTWHAWPGFTADTCPSCHSTANVLGCHGWHCPCGYDVNRCGYDLNKPHERPAFGPRLATIQAAGQIVKKWIKDTIQLCPPVGQEFTLTRDVWSGCLSEIEKAGTRLVPHSYHDVGGSIYMHVYKGGRLQSFSYEHVSVVRYRRGMWCNGDPWTARIIWLRKRGIIRLRLEDEDGLSYKYPASWSAAHGMWGDFKRKHSV